MVRPAILMLTLGTAACSVVLDPDDLHLEGAAGDALDSTLTDVTDENDVASPPDDGPEPSEVVADVPDTEDVPDVPDPGPIDEDTGPTGPTINLPGSSCDVAYQVDEGKLCDIGLPEDCASACGHDGGWGLQVSTDAVGGVLWQFEATGGFVVTPETSSLPSQLIRVQFGGDCAGSACGDPTSVKDFKVLVSLTTGGQTYDETFDVEPYRDDGCPAMICN